MVLYYGMSDKLPNLSYYDSTGQAYGFTKPYSEETARLIDQEVARIVDEQYQRAKQILREYAAGHNKLAEVLYTREVIFTEDVEQISANAAGPRAPTKSSPHSRRPNSSATQRKPRHRMHPTTAARRK